MQDVSTAPDQLRYVIYQKCPESILATHILLQILFYIKASRLEKQRNAFSRIGVNLWNEIPSSLRELPKKLFKLRINNKLFHVLKDKDSLIEVHKIISKSKCQ